MANIIVGGKIEWKITYKLKFTSYGCLSRMDHSFPQKLVKMEPDEFDAKDFKKMEKNANAKKLLYFGLGPDEYTCISECESAKDIWDALQVAHEGTNQLKQSRIKLLMRKFELFEMGDCEMVLDMYTCFAHITNELKSLGKSFTTKELVR